MTELLFAQITVLTAKPLVVANFQTILSSVFNRDKDMINFVNNGHLKKIFLRLCNCQFLVLTINSLTLA